MWNQAHLCAARITHTSKLMEPKLLKLLMNRAVMKTVVNNAGIAYDDHGMGLPVIFLHAFPLNRNMWNGELTALLGEERYRLVALDWRGFGESDIVNEVSTMEMFADDVAGVMDALGMQDAVLCGLSMGGYATFAFLRKYPQRVRG